MFKLKSKSIIIDIFLGFLLILLITYAYKLLKKPDQTPAYADHQLYQDSSYTHATYPLHTLPESLQALVKNGRNICDHLASVRLIVDKDEFIDQRYKDTVLADIKHTESCINHVIEEAIKSPAETQALLGPAGSSTRIVFERSLQQKLVQQSQKAECLVISVYNELKGKHKPVEAAPSLAICIANIQKLHAELV